MQHVPQIELIELAGGHLPPQRRAAVQAHLADCPDCRQRYQAQRDAWDLLGGWPAEPPPRALDAAAEAERIRQRASRPSLFAGLARLAAALLVAVGVGHLAGRMVGSTAPPAPAAPEQVARSMHLDVLADPTPVGLARIVLESTAADRPAGLEKEATP